MLGNSNNWNIIQFSYKVTSSEYIDKTNQVLLDVISENIAELAQTSNYGAINKTLTTDMGYYVIKFFSEAYTIQEDTTRNM